MSDKPTRSELEYSEQWCRSKIAELEAELDRAANEIHRLGMKCSNQEDQNKKLQAENAKLRATVSKDAENLVRQLIEIRRSFEQDKEVE